MSDVVPEDHRAAGRTPGGGVTSAHGATDQHEPPSAPPPVSPAMQRLGRFTAANMLRSMLPLILIILALVGFAAWRQDDVDPVTPVEDTSTVQFAARTASYDLQAPDDVPADWTVTSARTDAGDAAPGDPVTLELGYYTADHEYAGYVTSDDARDPALRTPLDGATREGTEDIGGQTWNRLRTTKDETAFSREVDGATLLVTGSAPDAELQTLAAAVVPYPAP